MYNGSLYTNTAVFYRTVRFWAKRANVEAMALLMETDSDSDIEKYMMCFSCGGNYTCACADKTMRGNLELSLPRLVGIVSDPLPVEDEVDTSSEADPEECNLPSNVTMALAAPGTAGDLLEDKSEGETESVSPVQEHQYDDDEGLTQAVNKAVSVKRRCRTQGSGAAPRKPASRKVARSEPAERVPQKKVDQLKEKVLQLLISKGPLSFANIMKHLDKSIKTVYSKASKFALPLRNFLANSKLGKIVVEGDTYAYNAEGVDLRPVVSKDTIVELVKGVKKCYATYKVVTDYFEFITEPKKLKANTAKCALHAALRRNNGRNGHVYGFVVDAVPAVPNGGSMLQKKFDLVTYFENDE